ncbi:MAG: hypothetical protein COB36_02300 [Alphaproteobacteria bacterium]|nr:MAG: hypothetical protein COB36_02300 [Alphaproteobacteria bacterium]
MSVLNKNGFTADEVSEIEAVIVKAVRDTFQVNGESGLMPVACQDNLPNVASDLEDAIEEFPESIDLHAHFSLTLVRQGKGQDAVAHMEEQAKKHPDNVDWQIAYAGILMTSPELTEGFNIESERIYSMDLTSEQKMTLNQYVAAVGEPPREVDNRSELLKRVDQGLANGVKRFFGLDND